MTDKQKQIFQKMVEGRINIHTHNGEVLWFVIETEVHDVHGPLYSLLTTGNKEWDDYTKAWEAYMNAPLMKALG